jgi:hypothetical protein
MPNPRRGSPKNHTSYDRFVSATSVILLIVLFFNERTRLAAAVSGILIFVVGLHPVTHFKYILGNRRREISAASALFLLVVLWVVSVWPRRIPDISYLRIEGSEFQPIIEHKPTLSIKFFNDSVGTISYHEVSACSIRSGVSDMNDLERAERDLWNGVLGRVEDDRNKAQKESNFYIQQAPAKAVSLTSVECGVLTPEQEQNLLQASGVTVIVGTKFVYSDDPVGERGLESCVFTQGKGAPVYCSVGHNGPAKVNKLYWWNMFF